MTRKNLVAEILTSLKQYDEAGLIDYRSINRWIHAELRRFGANLMVLTEKVLHVENGQVDLPENFYTLHLATKCEPYSQEFIEGCEDDLQSNHMWKERTESTYVWDNQSGQHIQEDYKVICEKVYFHNCTVNFRYRNPQILKLTKGIKREYCANDCKNYRIPQQYHCPYEINIVQNKAQFNFKKGTVYIQYYGFPTDEDGDLLIPDTRSLIEYLMTYCKRKIIEDLFLSDDDSNVVNKLNYLKQEERELFSLAQTAVKFEALGNEWDNKIKAKNRIEINRYERMFPH